MTVRHYAESRRLSGHAGHKKARPAYTGQANAVLRDSSYEYHLQPGQFISVL